MYKSITSEDVFTDTASAAKTATTTAESSTTITHDEKFIQSTTDISGSDSDSSTISATDESNFVIQHSANVDKGAKQMNEQEKELARLQAELRALED